MTISYRKTTAIALATFLMTGTVSVQAMDWKSDIYGKPTVAGDIGIKFISTGDFLKNSMPIQDTYDKNDVLIKEVAAVEFYTNRILKLWKDVQNKEYKKRNTFMDILMGVVSVKGTCLDASGMGETSQFRAILKGIGKSTNINPNDPIWTSIDQLKDKKAAQWWQAVLHVRSKDSTFFKGYFDLTKLLLYKNQLKTVDVSQNTALKWLYLSNNQLKTVDVSKNTALTRLYLNINQLTTLDVRKNTALTKLYLSNNQLKTVDVSKNTALTRLYLHTNHLKKVDVSKNTALIGLNLYSNLLETVDVSQNTALMLLFLYKNQLTKVDVSKNTALIELHLSENPIKMLLGGDRQELIVIGAPKNNNDIIN